MIDYLKSGDWATRDRLVPAALLGAAAYLVMLAWFFSPVGPGTVEGGTVVINDTLSFWMAGREAVRGAPELPYITQAFAELQRPFKGAEGYFTFFYPPTFLMLTLPLGLVSGILAYVMFAGGTLAAGALACSAITRNRDGALIVIGLPLTFNTLLHGQNGLLSLAFFGGGLALLAGRREIAAGICIGLLTFKPQLGVLIPFALLATGYWRTFLSAAVTTVLFAAASWLLFGTETWMAFLAQSDFATRTLASGLVEFHKMISIFAGARLLGASVELAYGVQAAVSLALCGFVCWVWRSPADFSAKAMILLAASLLATPFALTYDTAILTAAFAFYYRYTTTRGQPAWSLLWMVCALLIAVCTRWVGELTAVPIGPLAGLIVLWTGWRCARESSGQIRQELRSAPSGESVPAVLAAPAE